MAKKNKSDMAKGIRRSILNDAKSVDTEKESDANLQTAASIAKIAVTLDGFTAATLGSDKNLEDVFLDILDELKEIPASLRELEKKNSKVIESITTAILKLEKELENTNDPKKQKALIEAIAELKGEGQAAIDKSAADAAPTEPKGPTSFKEQVSSILGVTPESREAAGGSSFKAFTSALKKDARATFGLETPDAPAEPKTIEGVLEEKREQEEEKREQERVQKKIEGAVGDERGSMARPRARKKKIRDRNEETPTQPKVEGELGAADTEYLKTQGYDDATITKIAAAKASSKPVATATATPNETKTPQSSIFAGADSGSDTGTPDNKLLELVTNIDETTTEILGAIESLDLGGGGFGGFGGGGGGGGGGNKKKPPRKPRKPRPPKGGRFSRLMKGKGGKAAIAALAIGAVVGTAAYVMNKDDPEEEGAEGGEPTAEGVEGEGMPTGAGAAVGAGVGVAALGGAALYAGSGANESDGSGAAAPERARNAKGRFVKSVPGVKPVPVKGAGVMSRVSKIAGRFGKSGLGKGLGVAGKVAGKVAVPLAIGMEVFSAGSNIMEANRAEAAGEITHKQANQAKGKAAGGATGAIAGAVIGQALIPIPFGGAAIGGMVGSWLGKKAGERLAGGLTKDPAVLSGDTSGRLAQANAVEGSTVPTSAAASVINNTTNNVNNVTNGGQSSQGANISLRDTHSSYMRFRDNRMSRVM